MPAGWGSEPCQGALGVGGGSACPAHRGRGSDTVGEHRERASQTVTIHTGADPADPADPAHNDAQRRAVGKSGLIPR
ncbi:unnamed protein product [Lota lota]